jgi:hypothetical protein
MAGVGVEEDDGCHLDGHAVAKTRVMFVVSKSHGRVETTESINVPSFFKKIILISLFATHTVE